MHLVVVIGGAVAGSEASFQLREKGFHVVCLEQNALPYGKIDAGLPKWHVAQRQKEREKIDARLNHSAVDFVPHVKVGDNLGFDEIHDQWKPSAILIANGAWKDRPLPVPGIEAYVGKGLLYQNSLVQDFNTQETSLDIPDHVGVIGGGLASLDVVKICQMEITARALRGRGIQPDILEMEKHGLSAYLETHGLTWETLGLRGTTLFYRKSIADMPISPEPNAELRKKILGNYQSKFLFKVIEHVAPVETMTQGDRLSGIKFQNSNSPGETRSFERNLFVSSIGSIPELIPGVPAEGERYRLQDLARGQIEGMPSVFVCGNAVTGKGNILASLKHARAIVEHLIEYVTGKSPLPDEGIQKIHERVKSLQSAVGYNDYISWTQKHTQNISTSSSSLRNDLPRINQTTSSKPRLHA